LEENTHLFDQYLFIDIMCQKNSSGFGLVGNRQYTCEPEKVVIAAGEENETVIGATRTKGGWTMDRFFEEMCLTFWWVHWGMLG
jgi:hypothetical protein